MDIGKRIKEKRKAAGLTQTQVANYFGIRAPSVSEWESKGGPSKDKLVPLARLLKTSVSYLLTGKDSQVPMESMQDIIWPERGSEVDDAPAIMRKPQLIPVVGRVQAGDDGLLHIDDFTDHPEGYLLWFANCAEAYALRIRGESMSPRYLPGEFVGVDPCARVLPSDEVIVFLADGRRMIKRLLWERDGQACFESVNKNYPNIVFDCEEIERLHLVLGHIPKVVFKPNI